MEETTTHVEPERGVVRPGVGVIKSVVNHEIEQVAPVPRVDGPIGSGTQVSFPLSLGEFSLAFVQVGRGRCEACAETGPEGGGKARVPKLRPGTSRHTRTVPSQGSNDGGVFLGFGVFEGEVVSAKAVSEQRGPDLNTRGVKKWRSVRTVP